MKKLLVPVDGSTASLNALRKAIEIAQEQNYMIKIVSVVEAKDVSRHRRLERLWINEDRLDRDNEPGERLKRGTMELLDAIEERINFHGVHHEREIVSGEAHEEILRIAEDENIDMIVIGNRGFSKVRRFFLGSVAQRVISEARCPVLVIHTEADI
ncbi:universal stress protein [Atopococcus tabaci]|uniref:universal stress protein n=1 Tax=Atopococcus tabaci TaxID=269774 RepID=UPI000423AC75|nr:universal stress protein [Atopococcus tabaci]